MWKSKLILFSLISSKYGRGKYGQSPVPQYRRQSQTCSNGSHKSTGVSSVLPGSYMNQRHIVDMEPARSLPGSSLNASGEVRNANYFWRQLLKRNPEMFSKGNRYKIEKLGLSPKVDDVWAKSTPEHQSFMGDVLEHHHIDQGSTAVPLPRTIHQQWTSALHGGN